MRPVPTKWETSRKIPFPSYYHIHIVQILRFKMIYNMLGLLPHLGSKTYFLLEKFLCFNFWYVQWAFSSLATFRSFCKKRSHIYISSLPHSTAPDYSHDLIHQNSIQYISRKLGSKNKFGFRVNKDLTYILTDKGWPSLSVADILERTRHFLFALSELLNTILNWKVSLRKIDALLCALSGCLDTFIRVDGWF